MNNEEILQLGISKAFETMQDNIGGPFGAVILDENQKIIAVASNTVLGDNDPTAHAEINAIREACRVKNTYDLSGCTVYTTCYPCPMCLSAIIWANIKKVYYACTKEDAAEIGFRDDYIYEYIKNDTKNIQLLDMQQINKKQAIKLFEEYEKNKKVIY